MLQPMRRHEDANMSLFLTTKPRTRNGALPRNRRQARCNAAGTQWARGAEMAGTSLRHAPSGLKRVVRASRLAAKYRLEPCEQATSESRLMLIAVPASIHLERAHP